MKLRHIADIAVSNVDKKSVEGEQSVRLCNYTDVYNNPRIESDHDFMTATATPQQVRQFALREGDVLITKDSETPDDIGVPAYVNTDMPDVLCGYHLAILRPRPSLVDGRYLYWAVAADATRQQFGASAFGITRFGLRLDAIANATVPLPDITVQQAIAGFLDAATSEIDALLTQYDRMIALINERRAALIGEYLNGAWPMIPLKRCAAINARTLPEDMDPDYTFRYLDISAVGRGRTVSDPVEMRFAFSPTRARRVPSRGDTIVSTVRTYLASVLYLPEAIDYIVSTGFAVVSPGEGINPRWLAFTIESDRFIGEVVSRSVGVSYPAIAPEDLGSIAIAVPPLNEQVKLAESLVTETEHIDATVARIERQVRLLHQKRQALITAAVTGHVAILGAA